MSYILFFMKMQLADYQQSTLVYIIILITGIGDTVAEPIGIRFGKHRDKVRPFASDREYTRSLEGSLSVFITGLIIMASFLQSLTSEQLTGFDNSTYNNDIDGSIFTPYLRWPPSYI